MKLAPYPKYKPSGVEWLGGVPEHWDVQGLKYVCRFAYGDSLASEDREEGDVPVFGSNGRVGTHTVANTRRPVIIVGRKGSHGKVNFSASEAFAIDTTYFIDTRFTSSDLRWLFYALGTLVLDAVSKDSAVPGLAREDAYAHSVAVPVIGEQQAIADFLDRETAKIDTLVAKKRTLIERLKEKRTALITRTVTRGLPPDAATRAGIDPYPKLKPSGIDWLGEVPEHWVTWKATHGFRKIGSGTTPKSDHFEYYDGNIPWVTTSELRETVITNTTKKVTAAAMHEYPMLRTYPKGTLLFAMYGATIGRLGILGVVSTVNQACAALAEPLHLDTWFVYYWLQMRRTILIVLSAGGGQPNLSQDDLRRLRIPAPQLDEQRAIANFLNREAAKIDSMVAKIETAIERLQEYRTALITAAVTGKIDVREAAA